MIPDPSIDVRRTNWWYLIPPAAGTVLVVGDAEHAATFDDPVVVASPRDLRPALRLGPFAGVAVPDLDALAASEIDALDTLRALAASAERGGWIYGGFSNRPLRPGGMSLAKVRAALRVAGLDDHKVYLAAPDHLTPAYLIPSERRAEVDFFLRVLFFPYSTADGATRAAARRTALRMLRAGAAVSPTWLRARSWPSLAVVARRSPVA